MTESEMETSTGVALDVWDIVAVVIYFGLIMGVGLMVSLPKRLSSNRRRAFLAFMEFST